MNQCNAPARGGQVFFFSLYFFICRTLNKQWTTTTTTKMECAHLRTCQLHNFNWYHLIRQSSVFLSCWVDSKDGEFKHYTDVLQLTSATTGVMTLKLKTWSNLNLNQTWKGIQLCAIMLNTYAQQFAFFFRKELIMQKMTKPRIPVSHMPARLLS